MSKLRLNEKAIARMATPDPSGRDALYWDTELKGFGVRCSGSTNSKMYVVQRDLAGGKTRRVNIGPTNTLSLGKARERAADILDALRRGIDPKRRGTVLSLRSALEDYLAARKDLAKASVRMYRQVERTLEPWLDLPLAQISGDMVEARHRSLAAIGNRTSTANFTMRTFGILWNFAAERHPDLPTNPVKRLRRQWYAEPRRVRHVSAEQMPEFYKAVCAPDNAVATDYILLMLFTGLRRNEAASLRWADVDLIERVIRLPAASTKAKRKLDLPMSDVVRDLLVARRALGNAHYVFPGKGPSRHIGSTQKQFTAIAKATGIVVSAHDLRRTYATVAASCEISPYALKGILNHALGSDVTAGYVILPIEVLRLAVQKVADKLKLLSGVAPITAKNVRRLKP
jgi:integrase